MVQIIHTMLINTETCNNNSNHLLSITDPLEQFEMHSIFNYSGLSVWNLNTTVIFGIITVIILHSININQQTKNEENLYISLESSINKMVRSLLIERIVSRKNSLFYNITFVALFILTVNLMGLIPYSWTMSSWFIVVLFITLSFFININVMYLLNNGWMGLSHFLPKGTPIVIAPFLFLIEIVSYFSRVISLSVRLFANMLSGHALLKILISFAWTGLIKNPVWFSIAALIWIGIIIILILECLIAGLQAYVFTLLLIIYFANE